MYRCASTSSSFSSFLFCFVLFCSSSSSLCLFTSRSKRQFLTKKKIFFSHIYEMKIGQLFKPLFVCCTACSSNRGDYGSCRRAAKINDDKDEDAENFEIDFRHHAKCLTIDDIPAPVTEQYLAEIEKFFKTHNLLLGHRHRDNNRILVIRLPGLDLADDDQVLRFHGLIASIRRANLLRHAGTDRLRLEITILERRRRYEHFRSGADMFRFLSQLPRSFSADWQLEMQIWNQAGGESKLLVSGKRKYI